MCEERAQALAHTPDDRPSGEPMSLDAAGSPASADAASSVASYDVVLLVSPSLALLQRWDEACRQQNIAFFGAASRGACSFFFVDLQTHTYSSTVRIQQLFQAAFSGHFHNLHMAYGIPK